MSPYLWGTAGCCWQMTSKISHVIGHKPEKIKQEKYFENQEYTKNVYIYVWNTQKIGYIIAMALCIAKYSAMFRLAWKTSF